MHYYKHKFLPVTGFLLLLVLNAFSSRLSYSQAQTQQCDQKYLEDGCLSRVCSSFRGNYDQLRGNIIRECLDSQQQEVRDRATLSYELIKWTLVQQEDVAGIERYEDVLCNRDGTPINSAAGAFCPNALSEQDATESITFMPYLAETWWRNLDENLYTLRDTFEKDRDRQDSLRQDINLRLMALQTGQFVEKPLFNSEIDRLEGMIRSLSFKVDSLNQQLDKLSNQNILLTTQNNACRDEVKELNLVVTNQKRRGTRNFIFGSVVGVAAGGLVFGGESSSSPSPPDFPDQ